MAINVNNPLVVGARGMLGKVVVFRQLRGKTVISAAPRKRTTATVNEVHYRNRFKEASAYAKRQMADPVSKAEYATGINDKTFTAYMVAMTDWLKAPVIHRVVFINGLISVHATDDFNVERVCVSINTIDGELIISGEAHRRMDAGNDWDFDTDSLQRIAGNVKVRIVAQDKAGNEAVVECAFHREGNQMKTNQEVYPDSRC